MIRGELLGRWTRGRAGRAAHAGGMQGPCLSPTPGPTHILQLALPEHWF